jgi:23S rRNA (uracil1939-C5)-methyltransferase
VKASAVRARLRVESLAAGGDGVARHHGLAVFVPRTAPGDVVDAEVRVHGRLGRARVLRVVEASQARVTPRCQHYEADDCGGCQVQHVAYPGQLEAKRRVIQDALARIARRDVEVPPVVPSPDEWGYRARLTLAMRRVNGALVAGLHGRADPDRVFALRECPITEAVVVAAWREVVAAERYLPSAAELRGVVRRLGGDLAFLLQGGTRWDAAREFTRRCPSLHLVRWQPAAGAARTVLDRRQGGEPAAAFAQVNAAVAALLAEALISRVRAARPAAVVDAYAGTGVTARALAAGGVRVSAIELDAEAAAFARERLQPPSRVVTGRVEEELDGVLPADLAVLNPPRRGVDMRVTAVLEERGPPVVLYVSCDPGTLARDLLRLPRYGVTWVQAYDMFPQTSHVETICELRRGAA